MYNISTINIGKVLKKYRKIKGLSLEYVGDKICKTKSTVSKYEKGEIIPDFLTILELSNVLDINLSEVFPYISPIYLNKLPFNSNFLYLYYLTDKKLIVSTLELTLGKDNKYNVFFYNGFKKNNKRFAYYYEGELEYSDYIAYINLKNCNSEKLKMERVQIIVDIPLTNNVNLFNCFVTGLTPNFIPVIKRGIISTEPIQNSESIIQKLKLSKEEIHQLISDNSWILNTKNYDDDF